MITSLIFLMIKSTEARSENDRDESTVPTKVIISRTFYRKIGIVGVVILSLNVLLRVLLDRVTYTIGYDCRILYNQSQVESAPSNFPDACYVTHNKKINFLDNGNVSVFLFFCFSVFLFFCFSVFFYLSQ